MSTYEHFIDIDASADSVYRFISNPENLPQFLPQVDDVEVQSSERLILIGIERRAEADLHLDPGERTMRWNSLSKGYRGRFHVTVHGERCRLTVTHTLDPSEAKLLDRERPRAVDEGQTAVLDKIRQICEAPAFG